MLTRKNHTDAIEINVEVAPDKMTDSYQELKNSEQEIKEKLRTVLGLAAKVNLVSPNSIQRFEGKAKRIIDKRGEEQ